MEFQKHDRNIEKFYTAGSKVQMLQYDLNELKEEKNRFISFGYWENEFDKYTDATKRLLQFFIENSKIGKAERILNVACGYGGESFTYFDYFKPVELIGVDITKVHIDYANWKAKMLNLADRVKFIHSNAVNLQFPDNSFSQIMGIEGPAHFNTRQQFFQSAGRVLKPGGELLLTDVILHDRFRKKNVLKSLILKIAARGWVTPTANQVQEHEYISQLEKAGFEIVFLHKIGAMVYPGYSSQFGRQTFKENIGGMGLLKTIGIAFIGKLLGFMYKNGIIDYIYVKARKKQA